MTEKEQLEIIDKARKWADARFALLPEWGEVSSSVGCPVLCLPRRCWYKNNLNYLIMTDKEIEDINAEYESLKKKK